MCGMVNVVGEIDSSRSQESKMHKCKRLAIAREAPLLPQVVWMVSRGWGKYSQVPFSAATEAPCEF